MTNKRKTDEYNFEEWRRYAKEVKGKYLYDVLSSTRQKVGMHKVITNILLQYFNPESNDIKAYFEVPRLIEKALFRWNYFKCRLELKDMEQFATGKWTGNEGLEKLI